MTLDSGAAYRLGGLRIDGLKRYDAALVERIARLKPGAGYDRSSLLEAQQRLQEATERLGHLASDFGQSASGRVDKLEHLFEDRVAKALHRLGMPSLLDIQMLSERVAQLESQVQALQSQASKASGNGSKVSPAAKKPAAKASRPAAKPAVASRKKSA